MSTKATDPANPDNPDNPDNLRLSELAAKSKSKSAKEKGKDEAKSAAVPILSLSELRAQDTGGITNLEVAHPDMPLLPELMTLVVEYASKDWSQLDRLELVRVIRVIRVMTNSWQVSR